jgi:hypothetical protein
MTVDHFLILLILNFVDKTKTSALHNIFSCFCGMGKFGNKSLFALTSLNIFAIWQDGES